MVLRRAIDDPAVSKSLVTIFNDKEHADVLGLRPRRCRELRPSRMGRRRQYVTTDPAHHPRHPHVLFLRQSDDAASRLPDRRSERAQARCEQSLRRITTTRVLGGWM